MVWQMPFGELCDLIAIEQIKKEGAKLKHIKTEEEEREEFLRCWHGNEKAPRKWGIDY